MSDRTNSEKHSLRSISGKKKAVDLLVRLLELMMETIEKGMLTKKLSLTNFVQDHQSLVRVRGLYI